jgi:DNA processing protein
MAGGIAEAGVVVVSGMARGLDAVAHGAALDAGGATIGILGNGLGVIYPAANRRLYDRVVEHGLLLTEFPPGERPGIGAFPRRNRLISGLARVTVVIEAAEGSGTLITVGTALAQGRDVMAVPGDITSPTSVGTNRLIRDGAEPLLQIEDLLAHYPEVGGSAGQRLGASAAHASPPDDLSPLELSVFDVLRHGPAALDQVIEQTGAAAPEALAAISSLELRGVMTQLEGKFTLTA